MRFCGGGNHVGTIRATLFISRWNPTARPIWPKPRNLSGKSIGLRGGEEGEMGKWGIARYRVSSIFNWTIIDIPRPPPPPGGVAQYQGSANLLKAPKLRSLFRPRRFFSPDQRIKKAISQDTRRARKTK